MSVKTNKSYTKRLKLTASGKVLARKPGFNHFNAKQSRTTQLAGKKMVDFAIKPKDLARFIPHQ